jgi:hypothetical protein
MPPVTRTASGAGQILVDAQIAISIGVDRDKPLRQLTLLARCGLADALIAVPIEGAKLGFGLLLDRRPRPSSRETVPLRATPEFAYSWQPPPTHGR